MKYISAYSGPDTSFWETFPYFEGVAPFTKLYKEDRSARKNKSSKVMWFFALSCDLDSEFNKLNDAEKMETLTDVLGINVEGYLGSKEEVLLLRNAFEQFIDTVLAADVRAKERKLMERSAFIDATPYSLDEMVYPGEDETFKPYKRTGTAQALDTMLVGSGKIHNEIRDLRAKLKEQGDQTGKGGKEQSFSERRLGR